MIDLKPDELNGVNDSRKLRNLPPSGWQRLRLLLTRAIRLRCPECGSRGIFRNWLTTREWCLACDYEFAREGGYFLGAQHVNLVVAEVVPIALFIALFIWSELSSIALEAILIPAAIALPMLRYPLSCSMWMALDLFLTPVNQR